VSRNRQRSSFSRNSGARRVTTWATVTQTLSITAANQYQTFDLLANFKADGGTQQGVTITRTHLRTTLQSATNATTDFTYGLIRGQNTDVGTNIAGAPVPDADPYEDWLLWRWLFTDQNGNFNASGSSNTDEIDIKAMRKLPELQMTYNYVLKVLAAPAYPMVFQVTGRVLLTLP